MVFDLAWQMLSNLVRIPKIPTAMIDEKQIIPIIKWAVSEFFYWITPAVVIMGIELATVMIIAKRKKEPWTYAQIFL